ncbi:hypothetical protein A3C57_00920 [Candidatus Nomurabacteria bacterium RIFCSPHIGHO2_02_FULL_33_12]|nr:MAG: hypothetical protein A3C57_00920 [Candidatus Nomurabacteria bacterium RIFCSPHIGHO2_02_FULL_33_12]
MESKDLSPKPNDNYILTPDEERVISEKAEELYAKRIAPYAPDLASPTREAIINFQKLAFVVDHYFEHNEQLNPAFLNSFWSQFQKFLDDLQMPRELHATILQDIKDYADIEASIRIGKKLAEYEIKFFYFKKSCDVRMQRHIIRFLNKHETSSSEPEIVRDILEEIEDDVDDIEEDKLTPFGGNRFLEILSSKDVEKLNEYNNFINSLSNAPQDLVQRIGEKISKFDV